MSVTTVAWFTSTYLHKGSIAVIVWRPALYLQASYKEGYIVRREREIKK